MSLKVDNGTNDINTTAALTFSFFVTKESKETQLLAGPNMRVTKAYSSSKASLFRIN